MEAPGGRAVHAALRFARGGGRTFLQGQLVPYPFHITRPHAPGADPSEIVTLILQSAAGGLYRGDRLVLDVAAGAGARAHLTSQAATVVHATPSGGIAVDARLRTEAGAFLALTAEPNILFPDASLSVRTEVTLGPDATVILAEGYAVHDPQGRDRPFTRLATGCRVVRNDGTVLVREAGAIDGAAFLLSGSPLGPYRAMGTVLVLGNAAARLRPERLATGLDGPPVLAGATTLPNGAGVCVRLLATGGGPLARGLDAVWEAGFTALTGRAPPPRRR